MIKRIATALIASLLSGLVHSVELTSWHWAEQTFNVSSGDLTTTSVGPENWEAAFAAAVGRWNGTEVPFSITTDTDTQLESCDFNDPNTSYFSADACGQPWSQNVVGLSVTWSTPHSGRAVQTSILFNSAETWDIYDGPPQAAAEFTRVAVHELGHSIGLGHSTTAGAIMEPVGSTTIAPQNDDLAGVNRLYNVAGAVLLPDINGDGNDELAAVRARIPGLAGRTQVREVNDGARLRSFSYFSGFQPRVALRVDDLNSNGVPELALVHSRISDGRTLLEVRDPSTGANVGNVFYSPGYDALFAAQIADISGNGVPEVVVVMVRRSDSAVAAQVRDPVTKALVRQIFYPPGMWPAAMAIVPDTGGADDIAVALVRSSDQRVLVQSRDSNTGAPVTNIWQPPGFSVHDIEVVADTNANNEPDIATMVTRDSDGSIGIRYADSSTAANLRTVWYRPPGSYVYAKRALAVLPDSNGNGAEEVAMLVQLRSTQRTVVVTRDTLSGAAIGGSIFISPDFDAEAMLPIPSINGNGSQEISVFGFDGSFTTQIAIYDSATGTRASTLFYPNML